jgi:predicted nucleotidyltransferase
MITARYILPLGTKNMHPSLKAVLEKTITIFRDDPRVLAAYYFGSVNTEEEDELSDVDALFIIAPESFDEFDRSLPALFSELCPRIHLWWPERFNRDDWKNYAILFEDNAALLQYDMTFMKSPGPVITIQQEQFIFDKAGLLKCAEAPSEVQYDPQKLRWTVEMFWVYAFIAAKYLKREDIFKSLYAQEGLRDAHLAILGALKPVADRFWWPKMAKKVVPEDKTADILLYFGAADIATIAQAFPKELANFSRDARLACRKWQVEYPEKLEQVMRKHISKLGSNPNPAK